MPETTSLNPSLDGFVTRYVANTTWDDVRNGAGTAPDEGGAVADVYFNSGTVADTWWIIRRIILLFDTSSLAGATILSAYLSVYGFGKVDYLNINPRLNVYASNPASNTGLVAADYGTLGTTAFCDTSKTIASFTSDAYNNFTLNAAGIAAISTTGITKLGLREVDYDAADVAPAWSNNTYSIFRITTTEKGSGYKPRLVITYSPAPLSGQRVVQII